MTKYIIAVVIITMISGVADAFGFIHSAYIWQENRLVWREVGLSALGFAVGITAYWLMLRYMQQLGVTAPELQSVFWFAATMIGVALGSGAFFGWHIREQMIALAVIAGVGWLLVKTG